MKKSLVIFILIIFSLKAESQNLECHDFKNGTFIVTSEGPLVVVTRVTRKGNNQTEVVLEKPKEFKGADIPDKTFLKLNWISDCSYVGKFSSAKTKLTETQKFINDNGGILIEKIKIEGNCFYYTSRLNKEEKDPLILKGKICKE